MNIEGLKNKIKAHSFEYEDSDGSKKFLTISIYDVLRFIDEYEHTNNIKNGNKEEKNS